MPVNSALFEKLCAELEDKQVSLVAVSKTKPAEDILALYESGQRDFGENYVQELLAKYISLPTDIRWHFIGHLQTNKIKQVAPFIYLIHAVDSLKLLYEINRQAAKNNRVIQCLLQVHIAKEETKFGFDAGELELAVSEITENTTLKNVIIKGLMGMASFTDDTNMIEREFDDLKVLFDKYAAQKYPHFEMTVLSMGMSSDYKIAIDKGSNMVRIGSILFGERM